MTILFQGWPGLTHENNGLGIVSLSWYYLGSHRGLPKSCCACSSHRGLSRRPPYVGSNIPESQSHWHPGTSETGEEGESHSKAIHCAVAETICDPGRDKTQETCGCQYQAGLRASPNAFLEPLGIGDCMSASGTMNLWLDLLCPNIARCRLPG